MKRKRRLKKWVKNVLIVIFALSIIVGSSDSENFKFFVISHLIAGIAMLLSGTILIKNMEE